MISASAAEAVGCQIELTGWVVGWPTGLVGDYLVTLYFVKLYLVKYKDLKLKLCM